MTEHTHATLDRRLEVLLIAAVAAALIVRLGVLVAVDPYAWMDGSDSPYYVRQAWRLAHGHLPGLAPVAPLYVGALSIAWLSFPAAPMPVTVESIPAGLLTTVRAGQVLASLSMVVVLSHLAARLTRQRLAAIVVAAGLGLGPAFVLEPFRVLTETLALACMAVGLASWVVPGRNVTRAVLSGAAWGLATLARPVMFGLPWLLAVHAVWQSRRQDPRVASRHALALVGVCLLTVLPWLVSLRTSTGKWLPEGLTSNLWIGAVGDGRWLGAEQTDRLRQDFAGGPDDYLGEVWRVVSQRPVGWLATRSRNLGAAILQPHFASDAGGASVWAIARDWLAGRAGIADLLRELTSPSGVLKTSLYAWHLAGLVLGAAGLWVARSRLPGAAGVLAVVILYFLGVHVLLTALPRYLLPIQLALWVAASFCLGGRSSAPGTGGTRA